MDLHDAEIYRRGDSHKPDQQLNESFDDLIGSTIMDIGFVRSKEQPIEGGLTIDYAKGGQVKRVVLGFTELGMWRYWAGRKGVLSNLDTLKVKLVQFARVRMPARQRIENFLRAVKSGDLDAARKKLEQLQGPTGEMLAQGLDHVGEPKELIEEVMFEKVLETRLSLNRLLSFIAVSAAAAPLMGLLGTVTGIINTFQLITVFGTGDASTLSSGISEALITTKFGLIVAIPSLFLHAYLSRKSKRMLDRMEEAGMSFINRIPSGERRSQPVAGILPAASTTVAVAAPQPAMATAQGGSDS